MAGTVVEGGPMVGPSPPQLGQPLQELQPHLSIQSAGLLSHHGSHLGAALIQILNGVAATPS